MPKTNQLADKSTILLLLALPVSYFLLFLLRPDGGINLDGIFYARMALQLPAMENNLFPPGYPVLLRLMHFFTQDYFVAGKVLHFLCLTGILAFSYRQKFYFRETILLLCSRAGIGIWSFSYSEIPFLGCLYLQFFLVEQYLNGKAGRFWLPAMISLQLSMLLLRYSGVFMLAGPLLFTLLIFLSGGSKGKGQIRKWLYYLLGSFLLMAVYLLWNKDVFGSPFGEHLRGGPDTTESGAFARHFWLNLHGLLASGNPFFSLVFENGETGMLGMMVWLVDVIFLIVTANIALRVWREGILFHRYLLLSGIAYCLLLFFSSFGAGLETIGSRLLAPGLWCIYLPVLFGMANVLKGKKMLLLGGSLLFFNLILLLKVPAWYPEIRRQAKEILLKNSDLRYFIIDHDSIPIRRYQNPLTGNSIEYRHPVLAKSYINFHALAILRPQIRQIDSSEAINLPKAQLIRNSACRINPDFR